MCYGFLFFLLLGLTACGSTSAGSRPAIGASPKPMITFPRDDAAHPTFENEWWYVVAHLRSATGHQFGMETTIFKLTAPTGKSGKGALTVYRTDVALTDVTRKRFIPSVSYVEPGLAPVQLSSKSLNERVDQSHLFRSASGIQVQSHEKGVDISLRLTPRRRPMLVGGTGLVPMGAGGASYYYSRVNIAASGRIRYRGRWLAVSGIAWMDHQWGNWNWRRIHGWTWMAFQLGSGLDFSVADFHAAGRRLIGATVSYPDGHQRTVRTVHISPLGTWVSPHTHARYPSGWRVWVPGIRAYLVVTPLVRDQEVFDSLTTQGSYWEGASRVTGTVAGKHVDGQVYVELTGYVGGNGLL